MGKRRRAVTSAGIGAGALLALPAAAQAEDFTVTNLNDDGGGSLREAIDSANASGGVDRVLFRTKLSGTIQLEGPSLSIVDPVEIDGPGARKITVRGSGTSGVFSVVTDSTDRTTISGLTITGGEQEEGGGIFSLLSNLQLTRVTLSGNSASSAGGGILSASGQLALESSTISGNSTDGLGGGIFVGGTPVSLTLANSTVSGNTADSTGGGVYLSGTNSETGQVLSSTVSDNRAGTGGGIYEDDSGAAIRGSIIAGNSASNAPDLDDGPWPTSFSLIGDTNGATNLEDDGGNLLNVDPKLKPLRNNGGPTDTHAFKKSPAKNKGPSDAPNSDQRGAPRKGKADIGAYELAKCKGVIVNRVGTAGKDKLKGTKKKDGILGLGGNDKLSGKKGKDGLCGGSGKDKLKGGPGKDKLNGGPGKDKEIQ